MTSIPVVLRPGRDPLPLTWDFNNRMVSADVDNDSTDDVFYEWDALGRRVARDDGTTDTIFVQSGQQTIAEYTSSTAATSPTYAYVYASSIDEPVVRDGTGGLRYFHRGQQYSITALTDSSAVIKERYAYDAYGGLSVFDGNGVARAATAEGNRYTYTGRERDDVLDLYHYRARLYDSITGRFCSRDPIGYVNGGSLFRAYFATSGVDPTGLEWVFPQGIPVDPNNFSTRSPTKPLVYTHSEENSRCIFILAPFDIWEFPGVEEIPHAHIQGRVSNPHDIPREMEKSGCCEILVFGHQGAPGSRGGATIEVPGKPNDPVFDNPFVTWRINQVRKKNCRHGCSLFIYACGDPHPRRDPARRRIVARTGCHVFGTTDFWHQEFDEESDIKHSACKSKWGKCPGYNAVYVPMPMLHYPPGHRRIITE